MTVLYDPLKVMKAYGNNDTYMVTDEAATIVWKQKYGGSSVAAAIDAELTD